MSFAKRILNNTKLTSTRARTANAFDRDDILAFSLAKQFMVDSLNYPKQILDLEYNPRYLLNKDNIFIFTMQLTNR